MNFLRGSTRIYVAPDRPVIGHFDDASASLAPSRPDQTNRNDTYLTALLKLVPAEVVSVYMAIRDSATQHHALGSWFFCCLATCVIVRGFASLPKMPAQGGSVIPRIEWVSVLVSSIAFVLWAFSIGAERPVSWIPLEQWSASALAALFSVLAPLIVPGDRAAPGN